MSACFRLGKSVELECMELLSGGSYTACCTAVFVFFVFFTGFELPRALGLGLGLDRSWELIVLVIIGVKVGVWTLRM